MGSGMLTPEAAKRGSLRGQHGVVLIVSLLMLMILSILASISIRGASSTEQIANQSRQKTLAQQAAEAALRFCEQQVQVNALNAASGFAPEAAPVGAGTPFTWENMANWDAMLPAASLRTVAFTAAGDAGANVYFSRSPECMSQYLAPPGPGDEVFVTTARGFGPEVGAKDGAAPRGTEVWLQSVITMK